MKYVGDLIDLLDHPKITCEKLITEGFCPTLIVIVFVHFISIEVYLLLHDSLKTVGWYKGRQRVQNLGTETRLSSSSEEVNVSSSWRQIEKEIEWVPW